MNVSMRCETIRKFLDDNGFNNIMINFYEACIRGVLSINDDEEVEMDHIENVKVIDIDSIGHCALYLNNHHVICRFNDSIDVQLFNFKSIANVLDFVHFIQCKYGFDYNNTKITLMMDDLVHASQHNDFEWFEKLFKYKDDKWLSFAHYALYSHIWDFVWKKDSIHEIKCLLIKEMRSRNLNIEEDISL